MLQEVLVQRREELRQYAEQFLADRRYALAQVNRWGEDALDRLVSFGLEGKMVRGGLLLESARMFGGKHDDALAAGVALELVHASLLVHDDMMDRDRLRRGQPTLWSQYQSVGEKQGAVESVHFGQSLATCVGDLGFFLAMELLGQTGERTGVLAHLFGEEIAKVCLAQMEDVALSSNADEPDEEQILAVYRHKTARYTFSLPLMTGALFGRVESEVIDQLAALGEQMGIIFQIRDDALGLFGDEVQVGKPVGSDVAENKKTLHRFHLFRLASDSQRQELRQIFGRPVTETQVERVRQLVRECGVGVLLEQQMAQLAEGSRQLIDQLPVDTADRQLLYELVDYNRSRQK